MASIFRIGLPVLARRQRFDTTPQVTPILFIWVIRDRDNAQNRLKIWPRGRCACGSPPQILRSASRRCARPCASVLSVFHFNPPAFSPAGLPDYVRQFASFSFSEIQHNSQGKPLPGENDAQIATEQQLFAPTFARRLQGQKRFKRCLQIQPRMLPQQWKKCNVHGDNTDW